MGALFVADPGGVDGFVALGQGATMLIGLACLGAVGAVFVFLTRGPRTLRLRKVALELPQPRFALGMMLAAVVDLTAAVLTLWIWVPAGIAPPLATIVLM